MSHEFHKRWLKVSAITIGLFGPVAFFGTMPATNELARLSLDVLAWPVDGFPSYESPEIWFLSALTGGFLLGCGLCRYLCLRFFHLGFAFFSRL